MNKNVALTFAIGDYEHIRDLTTGRVSPEGIDLTCLTLPTLEVFYRFILYREWDVSEMSMAKYVSLLSQGDKSITAIPVFPSRMFRHSSIYTREDGPQHPGELRGKRVGLPEWAQTAAVYSRGLLTHTYGVALDEVEWFQAGIREPGRREKVDLALPSGVRCTPMPDRTLDEMLVTGELDAVLVAEPFPSFLRGDQGVKRMIGDYVAVERAYWEKTGIFPIMHVVALRAEILERHPWVAKNLFDAFETAKLRALERLAYDGSSRIPLPWSNHYFREADKLFGEDGYWPYGIEPNRTTLQAFVDYAHEQGVAHRRLAVEELFPPTLQSSVRV